MQGTLTPLWWWIDHRLNSGVKTVVADSEFGRQHTAILLWPTGFNEYSQLELSIFSVKQSDLQELPLALASPFIHHSQKKCYFLKYVTLLFSLLFASKQECFGTKMTVNKFIVFPSVTKEHADCLCKQGTSCSFRLWIQLPFLATSFCVTLSLPH